MNAPAGTSKAEREVRAALARFVEAFSSQSLNDLVGAWSSDVVDIQNGMPTLAGADALELRRRMIGETFERFDSELDLQLDEVVELAPDWVLVRGALEVRLVERATGERSTRSKRFMELWHRQTDGWRIRFGMTNAAYLP